MGRNYEIVSATCDCDCYISSDIFISVCGCPSKSRSATVSSVVRPGGSSKRGRQDHNSTPHHRIHITTRQSASGHQF